MNTRGYRDGQYPGVYLPIIYIRASGELRCKTSLFGNETKIKRKIKKLQKIKKNTKKKKTITGRSGLIGN